MQQEVYEEKRELFRSLGIGGYYTEKQKYFAFELIAEHGMRATARILQIPRGLYTDGVGSTEFMSNAARRGSLSGSDGAEKNADFGNTVGTVKIPNVTT